MCVGCTKGLGDDLVYNPVCRLQSCMNRWSFSQTAVALQINFDRNSLGYRVPKSLCFMDPSGERRRVAGLRLQFHCDIKIALRRMRSCNATSKNIRLGYKRLERGPAGYCLRKVAEVHGLQAMPKRCA